MKVRKIGKYIKVYDDTGKVIFVASLGNLKVNRRTLLINLTPGKDGSCFQDCKDCYAFKAERIFKTAKISRRRNFELAKNNLDLFELCLIMVIEYCVKRDLIDHVRYHEAGDFFSQSYLDMCEKTAGKFLSINFYAYSKNFHIINFDNCKALHVINSLPMGFINYGKKEYIENMAEKFNFPICPCNSDNVKKGYCGKDCTICMAEYPISVLFEVH